MTVFEYRQSHNDADIIIKENYKYSQAWEFDVYSQFWYVCGEWGWTEPADYFDNRTIAKIDDNSDDGIIILTLKRVK